MIIPLFSTHFSLGRSILTLDKPEEIKSNSPVSIFSIAKEHNLSDVYLCDNSMSGFLQFVNQCKASKVNGHFGLKMTVCENIEDKSEESLKTESKIIVWLKNTNGYPALCKLATKANTDGFYYTPRASEKILDELLTEDLFIAIPFYDSFLFNNLMKFNTCVFNYEKYKPIFFKESGGLPFDYIIQGALDKLKVETQEVKSVYYYKREDFKAYCTLRAISGRRTLDVPNQDHLSSNEFCFESYLENI